MHLALRCINGVQGVEPFDAYRVGHAGFNFPDCTFSLCSCWPDSPKPLLACFSFYWPAARRFRQSFTRSKLRSPAPPRHDEDDAASVPTPPLR
eukprot:5601549-Pleurochrysis_carterae.AAC.1